MKKVFLGFVLTILFICASGYSWYISSYNGSRYYALIRKEYRPDEKIIEDKGLQRKQYTYRVKGYNEKGVSQELQFCTFYEVKPDTYLEMFSIDNKEVRSWVGRERSQVPKNPLRYLS